MRITILADNTTITDLYFSGEPGLCLHISGNGWTGLFDLGYSGCFLKNARIAGIDVGDCDFVVFSHGHADHTWGLSHLLSHRFEQMTLGKTLREPVFYAHPDAFLSRSLAGLPEVGMLVARDRLEVHGKVVASREPVFIREDLVFLGEIPRMQHGDEQEPAGNRYVIRRPDGVAEDHLADDSALVWLGKNGLVIMTGCSHSGICAIVKRAREVCGDDRIQDIIGGFHLFRTPPLRISEIGAELAGCTISMIHPCHCTGAQAQGILSGFLHVCETGVGMSMDYD